MTVPVVYRNKARPSDGWQWVSIELLDTTSSFGLLQTIVPNIEAVNSLTDESQFRFTRAFIRR